MKKPKKNRPQPPAASAPAPAAEAGAATPALTGSEAPALRVREATGEPVAARSSLPVLLIALLAAVLFWADVYVIENGGKLDARIHAPFQSPEELATLRGPVSPEAAIIARGKALYNNCAGCHQGTGEGNAGSGWPPLAGSEWVTTEGPNRLIRIVLDGLSGPIQVKGRDYGTVIMPPFRAALGDEEIAAVLSYIRNDWGNKASIVTPAQVKKVRDETASRSGPNTAAELLQVSDK